VITQQHNFKYLIRKEALLGDVARGKTPFSLSAADPLFKTSARAPRHHQNIAGLLFTSNNSLTPFGILTFAALENSSQKLIRQNKK